MQEHLPVLQVVVPMVAAPVCVLLRRRALVLPFSIAVTWATLAVAIALLVRVLDEGVLRYALGGWAAPWGIEYRVDPLSAFVSLFVAGLGAVVLTFAPRSIAKEIPTDRQHFFCTSYLLCVTGLLGIAITGDLFNLFVFLEISALSSYALISQGPSRQALFAAFKYLLLGTIGATFILIGVGLMYMMTGTLNMEEMVTRLDPERMSRTVLVAFAFLTVGICLKMALFPLHMWLPNAYAYAPSVVTAFLAATATKVSVYVGLRFVFTIFKTPFAFELLPLDAILMPMALLGIFVTSTIAIFQRNLKRLLAYSSLAQIGYMVLGTSFASVAGLTGGIVHLFNHALTKGALFLAVGCMVYRLGSADLDDLRGVGRRMPMTTLLWVVAGLSLIGVPATAGFISKWYLIEAALDAEAWPVAVLILLSSLLAVVYVWRFVETAYFGEAEPTSDAREAPLSLLVPTAVLVAATVYFGLFTSASADVAQRAAEVLLEAQP